MDAQIRKVLETAKAFRSAELVYRHRLLSRRLNGTVAVKDASISRLRKNAERARADLFAALAVLPSKTQAQPAPLISTGVGECVEFVPPDRKSAAAGK